MQRLYDVETDASGDPTTINPSQCNGSSLETYIELLLSNTETDGNHPLTTGLYEAAVAAAVGAKAENVWCEYYKGREDQSPEFLPNGYKMSGVALSPKDGGLDIPNASTTTKALGVSLFFAQK